MIKRLSLCVATIILGLFLTGLTLCLNSSVYARTVEEILCSDPLLSGDHHLTRNSPARNAGLTIPRLRTDIAGEPRCIHLNYYIGGDE